MMLIDTPNKRKKRKKKSELVHGSLFTGIGGFDLAARRRGIFTVWQVEIDSFCRKVLRRHFPKAKRYRDVNKLKYKKMQWVDIMSAGFPCQGFSLAGKRRGDEDERNMWPQTIESVRKIQPSFAVLENVSALVNFRDRKGRYYFARILGDLAEAGYDAEWQSLPASAFGAPHKRERIWIVAYPQGYRWRFVFAGDSWRYLPRGGEEGGDNKKRRRMEGDRAPSASDIHGSQKAVEKVKIFRKRIKRSSERDWQSEPRISRMADGVPDQVDRLRSLGNAIVPAVAEYIFGRIIRMAGKLEKIYGELDVGCGR